MSSYASYKEDGLWDLSISHMHLLICEAPGALRVQLPCQDSDAVPDANLALKWQLYLHRFFKRMLSPHTAYDAVAYCCNDLQA